MNRPIACIILAILLSTTLSFSTNADEPKSLILSSPTIVIVIPSPSEIEALKDEVGFADFSSDFAYYTGRFKKTLEAQPAIQVMFSSVDEIRFSTAGIAQVLRRDVETGYGYIFYRPGTKPIVLTGIHIDDELVCTAGQLYEIRFTEYDCPP